MSPSLGMKLWKLKGVDEFTLGYLISCAASLSCLGALVAPLAWGVNRICLCYDCDLEHESILLLTRIRQDWR